MTKQESDERYEMMTLIKAQEEKIKDLSEKLEVATEAIDSILIYEHKKPSFEFFRRRQLALEKYRKINRN